MPESALAHRAAPIVVAVGGSPTAVDVADLCERLAAAVRSASRPVVVICDVAALTSVDIGTVDALCRLALATRRLGCRLVVRGASPELRGLLGLAGISGVVPCPESSVEAGR